MCKSASTLCCVVLCCVVLCCSCVCVVLCCVAVVFVLQLCAQRLYEDKCCNQLMQLDYASVCYIYIIYTVCMQGHRQCNALRM